jgi:hypothetical protein
MDIYNHRREVLQPAHRACQTVGGGSGGPGIPLIHAASLNNRPYIGLNLRPPPLPGWRSPFRWEQVSGPVSNGNLLVSNMW